MCARECVRACVCVCGADDGKESHCAWAACVRAGVCACVRACKCARACATSLMYSDKSMLTQLYVCRRAYSPTPMAIWYKGIMVFKFFICCKSPPAIKPLAKYVLMSMNVAAGALFATLGNTSGPMM